MTIDENQQDDEKETHLVFEYKYLISIIIVSIITFSFIFDSILTDFHEQIPIFFSLTFIDTWLAIKYLQPKIEGNKQPKYKKNAELEYQVLLDRHSERGSQIHTALSILIAGSFVVLIPIFSEIPENSMSIAKVLPFVSIILIIATISLHVSTRTFDKLSWQRINFIEKEILGIKGNNWIKETFEKRSGEKEINPNPFRWYQSFRHSIWPILLSFLLSIYVSIAIYFL